ncbi:hypothetical protein RT723_09020 [Psychrosphaera aquimarina]|uniref:Uncharacterized protein n=1 Tax=Psychrosphaera aquimarina TaxID=2044854 RepID=A0ABU3R139_9GAMM|nr:hypothetical protein [Psychrosphaera aquimarina]MDU0113135.1 hypothetical protein [Psychrosphaera aquimarina]
MKQNYFPYLFTLALAASNISTPALADGVVVDKVYHPYVLPNEREIEWRIIARETELGNLLSQRFGYGHSVTEYLTLEGYLIGARRGEADGPKYDGDFVLDGYEFEARLMLSDQGEYWADWGVIAEFEKKHNQSSYEVTSGLVFEKEIRRTSLTLNMFLVYEWGDKVNNEMETEFRAKYRYRWLPQFQPALELYTGQDYIGIGPAFMGIQRFNGQKQLKWEAGFITKLSNTGKDNSFRFALEYEF